ncbi:preprotein translocase subunit YajC [Motilibacter aurantiacus]|uniref:preprotein translocase subunit YajC n=1 Tax=Motilibacter aurantiacus TaxID=2714955 RepID=UPI00140DD45A|nr:preprotein translocase subunit YajC [Motilibacter aurantiacus]NHC46061.1 preprotein translocase subunit YajC [Motilibacter aurantiacus]
MPFVLIGLVFWLLLIRPAQARQRRLAQLQAELSPGARVVTTAGLYATVVAVDDDAVVLETSPGVTSRWARGAVGQVLPPDEAPGTGGSVSFRKPDTGAPPPDSPAG